MFTDTLQKDLIISIFLRINEKTNCSDDHHNHLFINHNFFTCEQNCFKWQFSKRDEEY